MTRSARFFCLCAGSTKRDRVHLFRKSPDEKEIFLMECFQIKHHNHTDTTLQRKNASPFMSWLCARVFIDSVSSVDHHAYQARNQNVVNRGTRAKATSFSEVGPFELTVWFSFPLLPFWPPTALRRFSFNHG